MKNKNCYISGPMTNDPDFFNKFAAAEYEIYNLGLRPVNPARLVPIQKDWTWEDYMREDLKHLLTCSYIYMLRGWVDSHGAKVELDLANALKMNVIMQSEKGRTK
jgi:hypothetical protein